MLKEMPAGRTYTPEWLSKQEKSATKRMEYHTERIVTVKVHPSVLVAIVLAGTFFVLATYLSN